MPTVLRKGPYRFFFYAGAKDEPIHIQVERDDNIAKFWMSLIRLNRSNGFGRSELSQIRKIIEEEQENIIRYWNEYFSH
jgi:Domain of unknown function (DUF4160)